HPPARAEEGLDDDHLAPQQIVVEPQFFAVLIDQPDVREVLAGPWIFESLHPARRGGLLARSTRASGAELLELLADLHRRGQAVETRPGAAHAIVHQQE